MRIFGIALIAAVAVAGMFLAVAPAEVHNVTAELFNPSVGGIAAAGVLLGLSHDLRGATAALRGSSMFHPFPVLMAPKTIEDLQEELEGIEQESAALVAKADEEERDLTDEELASIEENAGKITNLKKQITARQQAAPSATPSRGRQAQPEPQNRNEPGNRRAVAASPKDTARHGFANLGEFAIAARAHALNQDVDGVRKLQAAATTYGNEGTGADGGFLIPPEFARAIWTKVEAEDPLMSRCAELTPEGNSMTIPKDETTPWGSSGLQVYWDGEGATISPSKGLFETSQFRLFKLTALAPVTDEMLEDARGFESWIQAKVPGIMSHKINTAIIAGTGAGMPLGILNSPSLISVAKETSQPADTVWFANINKMYARMYAPWRNNSVWLVNQDVEPSLEAMAFQPAGAASMLPTTASTPVYLPPGGMADAPYARLKGRPVIPLQACKTIGDQGDIMLVDLKQYWILRKAGVKSDTSIHLYFDQSITAFRFIFRLNGQPAWSTAITPQNGSNTLSWAVALDDR